MMPRRRSALLRLALPEEFRQPRDVDGDAPRFVRRQHLRLPLSIRRSPRGLAKAALRPGGHVRKLSGGIASRFRAISSWVGSSASSIWSTW
jgi:hypothetical protein